MKNAPLDTDTQASKLLLSTLALYGIPSVFCSGAIIHSSSFAPFGISARVDDGFDSAWDVDGNYTPDDPDLEFVIGVQQNIFQSPNSTTPTRTTAYFSIGLRTSDGNQGKFVQHITDNLSFPGAVNNLAPGFLVGNHLRIGHTSNSTTQPYQFGIETFHGLASGSSTKTPGASNFNPVFRSFIDARGFTDGVQGYIGFSFDIDGNTHYGWATLQIDFDGVGGTGIPELTISEWAYNDVAGASIQVAAVPEPAETATAIGLLALGAAGVHRWRKNRAAKAA